MRKTILKLSMASALIIIASCGGGGKDQDGHVFNTVKISNQKWMTKNLNVSIFRNGDPIPEAKTGREWRIAASSLEPAWCYMDNNPTSGEKYGKLYNWYAVTDMRGLAPEGWHIPSDEEWTQLIDYLGGRDVAGPKMKSSSGWKDDGNGTNKSGFSALPGSLRYFGGDFGGTGLSAFFWSSTEHERDRSWAWCRVLIHNDKKVGRSFQNKECGFSVRCLKD